MIRPLRAAALVVALAAAPATALATPLAPVSAQLAAETDVGAALPPDPAPPVTGDSGSPSDDVGDWTDDAVDLFDAIRSGRWLAAVAAALLLVVYTVRRFALGRVKWFQTRAGGWLVNFALASATAIAVSLQAGTVGFGVVLDALLLGLSAAGSYQAVRDLAKPRVDG